MGWNLPDGCTDRDIDIAAGGYDERDEEFDDPELVEPEIEELEVHWSAADEGDARYHAEVERDVEVVTQATLPARLFDLGVVMMRAAAPEPQGAQRGFGTWEDELEQAIRAPRQETRTNEKEVA